MPSMPREVKILTAGLEETFLPFKKARVWLWGCVSVLFELIQNGTRARKSVGPSVELSGRKNPSRDSNILPFAQQYHGKPTRPPGK